MKNLLLMGILAATQLCSAQRTLERTNSSWVNPDLSIEKTNNVLIQGFTDFNPNVGFNTPTFKVSNPAGTPLNSFYLNFSQPCNIMDFVIKTSTIVLTGSFVDASGSPTDMYIAEVDFNGNLIQSRTYPAVSGRHLIPQQVIYSATNNHIVITGTEITGVLTVTNAPTIPKSGFIVAVNATTFGLPLFTQEMDTPVTGPNDSDMLEAVCEVPGIGYFYTGSANNGNEQNLLTMGTSFTGAVTHSHIWDNTNSRSAGASLLYRAPGASGIPGVYVLCNNAVAHTFEIVGFNANTGLPGGNFFRHVIASLPVGSGVDVNGFKLQAATSNQVVIAGYITSHAASILPFALTPFIMVLPGNVGSVTSGKLFPTNNNSTLSGYYDESGNSVYINTPDIYLYDPSTGMGAMVNAFTGTGYDLNISPLKVNACETQIQAITSSFLPPDMGPANYTPLAVNAVLHGFPKSVRTIDQSVTCLMLMTPTSTGTAVLSPNPATVELEVTLETGINAIVVTDMKGAVVLRAGGSERSKTSTTLDISGLRAGVYLIDITDTEGIVERQRFVKE